MTGRKDEKFKRALEENLQAGVYDCIEFVDRSGDLTFALELVTKSHAVRDVQSAPRYVRVIFRECHAYRKRDESYAWPDVVALNESDLSDQLIVQMADSDFIRWLGTQHAGGLEPVGMDHYVLSLFDDVFDVLCFNQPQIEKY